MTEYRQYCNKGNVEIRLKTAREGQHPYAISDAAVWGAVYNIETGEVEWI